MSKRNISYIKPQDPSFLRKIKEQIGYKEGPTVETKRQKLENLSDDEDFVERGEREQEEDEQPQVVVLKAGDLTLDEANAERKRIEKEESEKPADLTERIIFKTKAKTVDVEALAAKKLSKKSKESKASKSKSKLSFNVDDDEEEN